MIHILEVVLTLPSNTLLHHVLVHEGYSYPEDFLHEQDDTFNELQYPDESGTLTKIPEYGAYLLKSMKHFVTYQNIQGISHSAKYWTNISQVQFKSFLTSSAIILCSVPAISLALPSNICMLSVNNYACDTIPVATSETIET